MNILGVGGPELIVILVLMLIVAGPKRMMKWAYILGQYVAKFRRMWAETVDVLQKEFDDAGVEIQVPREMPTRHSLNKQASKIMGTVTDPMKETLEKVDSEVGQISKATTAAAGAARVTRRASNGHTTPRQAGTTTKRATSDQGNGFGAWSNHDTKPAFGSWTGDEPQDEE